MTDDAVGLDANDADPEVRDLLLGQEAGLDPPLAGSTADGVALTHVSSPWHYRICAVCGHSFRRGDRVHVEDDGRRVVHLAPELSCASTPPAATPHAPHGDRDGDRDGDGDGNGDGSEDRGQDEARPGAQHGARAQAQPAEHADLVSGLMEAWPPGPGARIRQLSPDDWRVDRRHRPGERPPACLYCGHTFRAGEFVVCCPCGREPECGAAVHRDPAAGLPCWERWRPRGRTDLCPVTLERVTGP